MQPDDAYEKGISIKDIFELRSAGFVTGRDDALISFSAEPIATLVKDLADEQLTDDAIAAKYNVANTSGWPVSRRRRAVMCDTNRPDKIMRIAYRPFDDRFL